MANNKNNTRKQGDGMLRLRKDGRWEGRIVIGYDEKGDPKTKNVTARTQEECEKKLKALKEELGQAAQKIHSEMTFGEWIDYWYQSFCKSGIDRNFLRACEDKKIISPKRTDSEWIVDKDYIPRDYSQEDVEKVWNAYLCRKMGLSYAQIRSLMQGEEISVRNTLNNLIAKYEKQIEELQALIEFMKYVKGIGFVPSPPNTLMGSTDFKNYLTDFIEYLDKDKKLKKMLGFMECISEIDDIQNPTTETIDQMETLLHDLPSDITNEFVETYSAPWLKLLGMVNLAPSCNDVQSLMHEIYYNQKQLSHNDNLTVLDFVYGFHSMLSHDSDMSMAYTKCFGEKAVDFFKKVLLNFLMIQEPDMFK